MERKNSTLGLEAACSAVSWTTMDQKHLWGRNYDFDRLAEGTNMTFLPRGLRYQSIVSEGKTGHSYTAAYACVGVGILMEPTPVLYEGMNEKGLMGGQLYYRGFASYEKVETPDEHSIQPPFLVYHLLAQCASVEEAVLWLQRNIKLADIPFFGTVPPLHWSFHDASGETIVVEPDSDGLRIYRNTLGVMTNSPGYSWHQLNLLNYAGLRDGDYPTVELDGETLNQCFSGSGFQGLPGDWSSPSRFVRLAFLKKYASKGRNEEEGVSRMIHLFQSAAFPLGLVKVSHQSHVTELDRSVVPFDYTVYTSIYCAESLKAYWTTYENWRVQSLDLGALLDRRDPLAIPLGNEPDFLDRTPAKGTPD